MSIIRRIKDKLQPEPEASDATGICVLSPGILGGQSPANFADDARLAVKDNLVVIIEDGRLGNKPSRLALGTPRNSQQRAAAYSRAGSWRESLSGRMIQQDTVFMRASLAENLAWH